MKIGDLTTGSKLTEYAAWLNPLNYSPTSLIVTGIAIAIFYKYRPTGEAQKVAKLTGDPDKEVEKKKENEKVGESKEPAKQRVNKLSPVSSSGDSSVKIEKLVKNKENVETLKQQKKLPTPDLKALETTPTKQVQFKEDDAPQKMVPVDTDYKTPLIKIREKCAQTPGTSKADRRGLREDATGTILGALKTSELRAIFYYVHAQLLKNLGNYEEAIVLIEAGRNALGDTKSALFESLIELKGQCKLVKLVKNAQEIDGLNTSKVDRLLKKTGALNDLEDRSDFSKYPEYGKLQAALSDDLNAELYYIFACSLMDAELFEDASKVNKKASDLCRDDNKGLLMRLRQQRTACGLLVEQQEALKDAHKELEEKNAEIERLKVGELIEIRKKQDQLYQKLCELEAQRRNEESDIVALKLQLLKSDSTDGQTAEIKAQIKEKEAAVAKIEQSVEPYAPPPPAPPPPPEDFKGEIRSVPVDMNMNELTQGIQGLKKVKARQFTAKTVAKEVEEQANKQPTTVTQKLSAQKKQTGKDAESVVRTLKLDPAPNYNREEKPGEK